MQGPNNLVKKKLPGKSGIILKADWEIDILRKANSIVAKVLQMLKGQLSEGVTTYELDKLAENEIKKCGGSPAFKGYKGYPASLCISINEEVVHGIPKKDKVLKSGDLVSMDIGVVYDGYVGDAALSATVGAPSKEAADLIAVTEGALIKGITQARPKNRLGDISHAIQRHVENAGYSVVKQFVGHGIGKSLHEPPEIPNFGRKGRGPVLKPGMVLAIEPMVNIGSGDVKILDDGWTAVTADGSLSAHFEHSVAITKKGPVILSVPD